MHLLTMFHTCAFWIFDGWCMAVMIARHTVLDKQLYVHHVLAYVTFYGSLHFLGYVTVSCSLFLMVELTATYLTLRWFSYIYEFNNSIWHKINTGVCAVLFFLVRILYYGWLFFGRIVPAFLKTWSRGRMPDW